jgi:hypothetical protein
VAQVPGPLPTVEPEGHVPWLVNVADMKRPGEPPTQFAASTGRLATVMITGAAPSPPVSRRRRDADEGADWAVGSES